MGKDTAIGWADDTFNPWIGCTKVSPACDHCYAETLALRRGWVRAWGKDTPEDDEASWKLVVFIRHLPKITEPELSAMEAMNPVSPLELKEREEEARFLEGKAEPRPASRPHAGHKPRK